MAAKKKAAKAGAGAVAAGRAVSDSKYVQRLIDDPDLRDELRTAVDSARKAYGRMNGKAPGKALEDRKVQKELKAAAASLKSATESLRSPRKRKRGAFGKLLGAAVVGGVLALALSEDLRKKALDALFGAEEEFEYTATTTPNGAGAPVEEQTTS